MTQKRRREKARQGRQRGVHVVKLKRQGYICVTAAKSLRRTDKNVADWLSAGRKTSNKKIIIIRDTLVFFLCQPINVALGYIQCQKNYQFF